MTTPSATDSASSAPNNRPTGWIVEFVLLAAIWGASFLFMHLGAVEFGPLPTAGGRVAIATVFLLPILMCLEYFHPMSSAISQLHLDP